MMRDSSFTNRDAILQGRAVQMNCPDSLKRIVLLLMGEFNQTG